MMNNAIDYNLHGLAAIRLLDAAPADVTAVSRQLGPIQGHLEQEPDIIIRFVDRLPISSPLSYLGAEEAGFTNDAFLVLRSRHKTRARVQIPFQEIGRQCEIVCERGVTAVPLLIPILNLTLLGKGILPLHASAFIYQGMGIVATGWSKGGKTESLLTFMAHGAAYVGDEWVYLNHNGQQMFGVPEPVRLWSWHLDQLPQYRARLTPAQRAKIATWELLVKGMSRADGLGAKQIGRWTSLLKQQTGLNVPPQHLFGRALCLPSGVPEKIFLVVSHETADITVQPIHPQEIAQRMVFSLQEEQRMFMSYYRKFRFAFPDLCNELVDCSERLQYQALSNALASKDTYAVYHPYPVSLEGLFEAIRPYCS